MLRVNVSVVGLGLGLSLMVVLVAVSMTHLMVSPQIRAGRPLAVLSSECEELEFWKGEDQEAIGGFISQNRQLFSFSDLQGVPGGVVTYTDVVKVNNTDSCGHMVMVQLEFWDAAPATPLNYLNIMMFDSQGTQQGATVHLVPSGIGQTVNSGFVYIAANAWFRLEWGIYWQVDAMVTDRVNIALTLVVGDHDVAVTDIRPWRTIVGQGTSVHIDVQADNQGEFDETFGVALYCGEELIETRSISLASQTNRTIRFTWNTTGVIEGLYSPTAVADPVPNESEIVDNTMVKGWILVTIPGDVNGDHRVDIFDIVYIAIDYGKPPPVPFDLNCDIDGDGDVDIFDIVIAAGHYGDSW